MILVISSRDDVTADLVQSELHSRGVKFLRFNTDDYPTSASLCFDYGPSGLTGYVGVGDHCTYFSEVDVVWYRKPGTPCISQDVVVEQARVFAEEESKAALTGLYNVLSDCFWVSRPERIRRANDKLLQLKMARDLGFETPRTLVTSSPDAASRFAEECNNNVVVKPLRSGLVEYPDGSVEVIYTTPLSTEDLADLSKVGYAPCLLQQYVSKAFELRVTIIGSRVFAVALDSQSNDVSRHDWRRDNSSGVRYSIYKLPVDIAEKCLGMMKAYGLEFSAFDLICTPEGRYVFLENNPNGQWAWLDMELPLGMIPAMAEFLISGASHEGR